MSKSNGSQKDKKKKCDCCKCEAGKEIDACSSKTTTGTKSCS